LEYISRYDKTLPQGPSAPSSAPLRQSTEDEWFVRPSRRVQASRSSFSSSSQASDTRGEELGQTVKEGLNYLSIQTEVLPDGGVVDILDWWRLNERSFPRLAQVAKDVLAIPIAGVGVEREFNTSKEVIGDRRHNISSQTFRKIMILRDAFAHEESEIAEKDREVEGEGEGERLIGNEVPLDEVDDRAVLPTTVGLGDLATSIYTEDEDEGARRTRSRSACSVSDAESQGEEQPRTCTGRLARKRQRPSQYNK
jgi:hypothetical protein